MGVMAKLIADGTLCQRCGGTLPDQQAAGHPRTCPFCEDQAPAPPTNKPKSTSENTFAADKLRGAWAPAKS